MTLDNGLVKVEHTIQIKVRLSWTKVVMANNIDSFILSVLFLETNINRLMK